MDESLESITHPMLEKLSELSQTTEGQLILAAPVAMLLVIVFVIAIASGIRRRKQSTDMAGEMELEMSDAEANALHLSRFPSEDETGSIAEVSIPESSIPEASIAETQLEEEETRKGAVAAAEPVPTEIDEIRKADRNSWLKRLHNGLSKTRDTLQSSLGGLFTNKIKIDEDVLEKLHEALFRADIGVQTADKLVDHVRATLGKEEAADWEQVSTCIKSHAQTLMDEANVSDVNQPADGPWVILIVGVNGVGKTTSIGKLAAHFLAQDKKVLLAAADTFRAAAIDQLEVWAKRLGIDVVKHKQGSDPAAVAYDAVKAAKARNVDVLLIDTAGRLHNKADLMKELGKINSVVGKDLPGAPHEAWLVIDATTGQNAVTQVRAFSDVVKLSGLVVTKLDGTAKGGVLIGIQDQFKLPIRYVGVGEKAVDLRNFRASEYVASLF
jgi:fused signal recognition particle receptor